MLCKTIVSFYLCLNQEKHPLGLISFIEKHLNPAKKYKSTVIDKTEKTNLTLINGFMMESFAFAFAAYILVFLIIFFQI